MAFCANCGTDVGTAAFCPNCGKPQAIAAAGGATSAAPNAQPGLAENVAGLLCYSLGWLTGIIFFLIDKRPFVRFHAAQSIVVFGGLHLINIALGMIFGVGMMMSRGLGAFGMGSGLYGLISLVGIVLWIVLMVKAYQGQKFEVPVAGGIAKSFLAK